MMDTERAALRGAYRELCRDYNHYSVQNPDVKNTQKLHRRVKRDLAALERFIEDTTEEEEDPIWLEQRRNQLQGFKNNFVNYHEKLKVAQQLKGVIALGKVFHYPLAPGIGAKEHSKATAESPPIKIEVDIVANYGSAWVQVRTVKIPNVDSLHWIGMPGHHKGLEHKLRDMMTVARSSEHWIRWQPPEVVIYCPVTFGDDVISEIASMGVHAISGDLGALDQIPRPPEAPRVTNLDVTAMCALISEVSHGGVRNPEVIQWAQRNTHWQVCLEHEKRDPLLPYLIPFLTDRPLITSEAAVVQFESLLATLSGPREKQRWQELLPKLKIYRTADKESWLSKRVGKLEGVTDLQASVFGLGDTERALTLTCNQKLVQKMDQQGIHLECFVHRPVWLTGACLASPETQSP